VIHLAAEGRGTVKWVLPERQETHVGAALTLLAGIRSGDVELIEPAHWLA
jgi:hypothetical protein